MFDIRNRTARAPRTAMVALYSSIYASAAAFLVFLHAGVQSYAHEGAIADAAAVTLNLATLVTVVVHRWTRRHPGTALTSAADVEWVLAGQVFGYLLARGLDLSWMVGFALVIGVLWFVEQRVRGGNADR